MPTRHRDFHCKTVLDYYHLFRIGLAFLKDHLEKWMLAIKLSHNLNKIGVFPTNSNNAKKGKLIQSLVLADSAGENNINRKTGQNLEELQISPGLKGICPY